MRASTSIALALLLLVVPAASACGVPTESDARAVQPEDVPFGLLDGPDQERAPVPGEGSQPFQVFLLSAAGSDLVPVDRRADQVTPELVVHELEEGPSPGESAIGLRSTLAGGDFVGDVEFAGGIATVDLSPDFDTLSATDQVVAIGQLVLSLTARPGLGRVAFTLDGDEVEVPRGDGSLVTGSVAREAYTDLLAEPPS